MSPVLFRKWQEECWVSDMDALPLLMCLPFRCCGMCVHDRHSHNLPKQVHGSLLRWSAHTPTLKVQNKVLRSISWVSMNYFKCPFNLQRLPCASAKVKLGVIVFACELLGIYDTLIANHLCTSCSPALCNLVISAASTTLLKLVFVCWVLGLMNPVWWVTRTVCLSHLFQGKVA